MGAVAKFIDTSTVILAERTTVPALRPRLPGELYRRIEPFVGWLAMAGLIVGIIGLIICGMMMIMGRRGKNQTAVEGAIGIPWVLAGLTVIALSSGLVTMVFGTPQ